mgnify:CR=1 FL=1
MLAITKEQIAELPAAEYTGRAIIINNPIDCRAAVRYLKHQTILGFDTETRPSFRKGRPHKVALLQVATKDECFLFRLHRTGFTPEMVELFENPDILKIGLSIKDDIHQLSAICEFNPANVLELQSYVKDYKIADNSLQKVYAIVFGKRISKSQRLTNWEAETLTEAQKAYASLDALACLQIYETLSSGQFDYEASPYKVVEATEGCE